MFNLLFMLGLIVAFWYPILSDQKKKHNKWLEDIHKADTRILTQEEIQKGHDEYQSRSKSRQERSNKSCHCNCEKQNYPQNVTISLGGYSPSGISY